jgi:uncharacterized membrane protein YkoI
MLRTPIRWLVLTVIGFVALGVLGGVTLAQGEISDEEAARIALARVPGTVVGIDRETDGRTRVVEVDVRDRLHRIVEVDIDARTGRILSLEAG